jgi:hypothetical protein
MKSPLARCLIPSLVAAVAFTSSALAATFNITFDPGDPIGGLPANTILSNQYFAATGATFSPNGFSGPGGPTGTWATNTDMTVVSSSGSDVGGLGTPSLVSGNILRSFNGWLSENGDASFRITFASAINFFSASFAGIATPASTRIFAFNGTTQVAFIAATTTTGQQTLSLSGLFTSIVITPGDFFDWVGVDNITFTTAGVPAVPEGGNTLALMAIGSGALLAFARWRLA